MKALVTGGCGFLGSFIVRELIGAGHEARILALPGEDRQNLAGLEVEVIEGDVRNVEVMRRAVKGRDWVFHAAAIYQDWAPDPSLMYDVNMRGTFHVLEAARRARVKKVVYTASIVSLGRPGPPSVGDERTAYEAWDIDFPYSRSKFFSRELAEYFGEWGLDVRVVCPGIVFGPKDIRPTPSGKLIINSVDGGPAVYFDGGASYVDVRDAARVHLLAVEKGKKNERYIATAHNLSNRALIETIDRVVGRHRRLIKLPIPVARGITIAMEKAALRTGEAPMLARDFFEYSLKPAYYRADKAISELGATFRPIEETITDAVWDFRDRGVIPGDR